MFGNSNLLLDCIDQPGGVAPHMCGVELIAARRNAAKGGQLLPGSAGSRSIHQSGRKASDTLLKRIVEQTGHGIEFPASQFPAGIAGDFDSQRSVPDERGNMATWELLALAR